FPAGAARRARAVPARRQRRDHRRSRRSADGPGGDAPGRAGIAGRVSFYRSRTWGRIRRIALIAVALVLAWRTYGDSIAGWFAGPDPAADIVITRGEFRTDLPGPRPVWFIGLENRSGRTTYDRVVLEAVYRGPDGEVVETDRIVVSQRLGPGEAH